MARRTVSGIEDHFILGGDLNGHVGADSDGYTRCHRGHGLAVWNDNGCRILDCLETHDLAVTNMYFKKRSTHMATYTSGGHVTRIDYWMVQRRDLKLVTNTKVRIKRSNCTTG